MSMTMTEAEYAAYLASKQTTEAQTITPAAIFKIGSGPSLWFAALAWEEGPHGYRAVGQYGYHIDSLKGIREVLLLRHAVAIIEFPEQPDDAVPTEANDGA